jgi:hypothetical protein
MEYLMTYGWAILVIMTVGVSMWRLGVFNMGSTAASSSGFEALKPLLPTCKGGTTILESGAKGFSCQFMNTAGTNIRVRDLRGNVDGQGCFIILAQNVPVGTIPPNEGEYVVHWCVGADLSTCTALPACASYRGGVWSDCSSGTWMPVAKEGAFVASIYNWPAETYGPCGDSYRPGVQHEIAFDIAYLVEIGGVTTEKHSIGTVKITGG